jgi:hypothetical protein
MSLFENDSRGGGDPLGGLEPAEALRQILGQPNRVPARQAVAAIVEGLAADLAVQHGVTVADAKGWLKARNLDLRRLYQRSGRAADLPAESSVPAGVAAKLDRLADRQAAGEELHAKALELVSVAGGGITYEAAMQAVAADDPELERRYNAVPPRGEKVSGDRTAGDAGRRFDETVTRIQERDRVDYPEAMRRAAAEFPDLAAAYEREGAQ